MRISHHPSTSPADTPKRGGREEVGRLFHALLTILTLWQRRPGRGKEETGKKKGGSRHKCGGGRDSRAGPKRGESGRALVLPRLHARLRGYAASTWQTRCINLHTTTLSFRQGKENREEKGMESAEAFPHAFMPVCGDTQHQRGVRDALIFMRRCWG